MSTMRFLAAVSASITMLFSTVAPAFAQTAPPTTDPVECQVQASVDFVNIANEGNGDLAEAVFIGQTVTSIAGGTVFDLMDSNLNILTDAPFDKDVPGVAIRRVEYLDQPGMDFILYGEHESGTGKESLEARINIVNGRIVSDLPRNTESQGDGIGEFGNAGQDEYTISADGTYIDIIFTVTSASDNVEFYIEPMVLNNAGECVFIEDIDNGGGGPTDPNPGPDVSGLVWDDLNSDGIRQDGEPVLEGAEIYLNTINPDTNSLGSVASTVSDVNGEYSFDGLTDGDFYFIAFSLDDFTGYEYTLMDVGTDDSLDSDVDPLVSDYGYGSTRVFEYKDAQDTFNTYERSTSSGEMARDASNDLVVNGSLDADEVDAGYRMEVIVPAGPDVSGLVWDDLNSDGIRQDGEPVLEGAEIYLNTINPDTNSLGSVASTVSDVNGEYSFDGLTDGDFYFIAFSLDDFTGYEYTLMDVGTDDSLDSDVDPLVSDYGYGTTRVFEFVDNQDTFNTYERSTSTGEMARDASNDLVVNGSLDADEIDAGYRVEVTAPGEPSITGRVWEDNDNDGIQSGDLAAEPGVSGVVVRLYEDDGKGFVQVAETVTNSEGVYQFFGYDDADFKVEIPVEIDTGATSGDPIISNLPETCTGFTVQDAAGNTSDASDSDIDGVDGSADFGFTDPFSVAEDARVSAIDAGLLCEDDTNNGGGNNGGGTSSGGGNTGGGSSSNGGGSNSGGGSSGGGGNPFFGLNPGGGSTPDNGEEPNFSGQQAPEISQDACLTINPRDLQFVDEHGVYSDILRETAKIGEGYMGKTQYAISGYGNATYEAGVSAVGEDNNALVYEVTKIMITAGLCYEIQSATDIQDDFVFPDLPKENPNDQWMSDLLYTANSLDLIHGEADTFADYSREIDSAEFVALMVRTYEAKHGSVDISDADSDLNLETSQWYYDYYVKADQLGILDEELMTPGRVLQRKTAFKMVVNAMLSIGAYTPEAVEDILSRDGIEF